MEKFIPQNSNGKIVKLITKEDCSNYLNEDQIQKINGSLSAHKKLTDFLPFYIEYTNVDTYTVDKDLVYSTIPQIIRCKTLVFNGGSITSYVHLTINATSSTTLTKPSQQNNYQILVSGSVGAVGPNGVAGTSGSNGKNGQGKSCEDADAGANGGAGNPGTDGGSGQNGAGTPVSSFAFGSIQLGGTTLLTVLARGGNGGNGGEGGAGGTGGSGGNGGASTSTGCTCYTNGGDGGTGGTGGTGGKGGNAGNGSSVNQGMTITVAAQADRNLLSTNGIAGSAGQAGSGGAGGGGGSGGSGGSGTKHGHDGQSGSTGNAGTAGGNGNGGSNGSMPQISVSLKSN